MKLYRCPWCGEKGIVPMPPKTRRNIFLSDADNEARRCRFCGQYFYDISGWGHVLNDVTLWLFLGSIAVYFILCICFGFKNVVINLSLVAVHVLCFFIEFFFHLFRPAYLKYSEYDNSIVDFEYSFKAKIKFASPMEGGFFRPKKHFYSGVILAVKFDYQEKEMNKYIYKNSVAIAFNDVKISGRTATCKAALILDEKIDKSFLNKGLKFKVFDNDDRCFAAGTVTGILQSKNPPVITSPKRKKLKNWQDPDYFN